jgi:SAM-dependent methyltransferase
MDNKQGEWENSYRNRDNFVFYPHEEVIRFVSRNVRKKIGLGEFRDVVPDAAQTRILDLGCGIGRHVIYCHEMGLEAYGVDLSATAVQVAVAWAAEKGMGEPERKIKQGDIRQLPWDDGYFDFAVSHGVLDSMPFEIARGACEELARKMRHGGLFYCDLISGDDSRHAREYAGEEVVSTQHERDTIQLYFNLPTIRTLVADLFEIDECILIRREDVLRGGHASRYHLNLRKS